MSSKMFLCACLRQRGFSLIEIMVAMVLGIVILLAVSEVFINNSRTRGEIEKTGRQIENGAYALSLLADELRNAGYLGEAGTQAAPALLPPICPTAVVDIQNALGVPVQGVIGSGTNCAAAKSGSDFIAIRRASTCDVGSTNCPAFKAGDVHLQVSACKNSSPGVVLLASAAAGLTYKQRDCTKTAPIYRLLSRVYYVTADDVLTRKELSGIDYSFTSPLVDGIETLQFEYGLDTDGDGEVNSFSVSPAATQWSNVVAVRVWLVARNLDPTNGYTDARTYQLGSSNYSVPAALKGFKRQVYSTTVNLPNVSGRRERS
ncbi:PilW family protein [Pseudomonas paeninsulae]|uniref:PilW family protein n=1 Tax=Pseudomonas paeninsulae TaxID=3110772 RepID=UPI002D78D195|nr:PilW family protein [Pseudomonas sp. IT1137]